LWLVKGHIKSLDPLHKKNKITPTPMETIMNSRKLEYLEGLILKGDKKMKIGGH
jgi:hypothetical protein